MKALIVVDVQNDFCPGGSLAVNDGDKIITKINELLSSSEYALKVGTLDSHPANHKSFASNNPGTTIGQLSVLNGLPQRMWPNHCVKNTYGEKLHRDVKAALIDKFFNKGENPEVDSYSGFFDNDLSSQTGLDPYLQEHNITEVDVVGLALDYCVKATALQAQALGFKTRVILSATRAVNICSGDDVAAINELRAAGIEVVA